MLGLQEPPALVLRWAPTTGPYPPSTLYPLPRYAIPPYLITKELRVRDTCKFLILKEGIS